LIAIQLDLTAERRRQGRRSSQAGSYASNKCSPGPCIKAATTLGLMQGSDPSVRSIGNFKARSDLCQKLSCNVGGTWRGHPSAVSLKQTRRPSTSTRARNLMAPAPGASHATIVATFFDCDAVLVHANIGTVDHHNAAA
jgi:hypothetical protein